MYFAFSILFNCVLLFASCYSRTAKVKRDQIYDFENNAPYIIKTLKSVQWQLIYRKAIRETEIEAKIPLEFSIINQISI